MRNSRYALRVTAGPGVGERAVWLRHGVVAIAHQKESAGERFFIVEPFGWTGESGWISARAYDEQLRPLADRATCERWLQLLRAPEPPRIAGNLLTRRRRQQRTIVYGTAEAQVAVS